MEVVNERCCGLDVHKQTVVAGLLTPGANGQPQKEIRTFQTLTDDLERLAAWLAAAACRQVAMESTGVYWQPVWNVLEGHFELLLVNARHVKAVPGRKTDVKDSEWLATLLRHGLLQGSYVPDRDQRELRELTRYRTTLQQERAAELNRRQKTLEGGNLKLASVVTDLLGKSGREILAALSDGATDAAALADLAHGKLRQKLPELERALTGRVAPHQRFLLARQLAHIEALDDLLAEVSAEIERRTPSVAETIAQLDTVPGIGQRTAEIIVAELGTARSRLPTAGQAASWAGLSPGNNQSGGKRRSAKTRKGNKWLRAALTEAAQAASHKKDSYLQAQYRRLAARRGKQKATLAVGHTILRLVYYLLRHPDRCYQDLGAQYFDERDRLRVQHRLVQRLEGLGFQVSLQPLAS